MGRARPRAPVPPHPPPSFPPLPLSVSVLTLEKVLQVPEGAPMPHGARAAPCVPPGPGGSDVMAEARPPPRPLGARLDALCRARARELGAAEEGVRSARAGAGAGAGIGDARAAALRADLLAVGEACAEGVEGQVHDVTVESSRSAYHPVIDALLETGACAVPSSGRRRRGALRVLRSVLRGSAGERAAHGASQAMVTALQVRGVSALAGECVGRLAHLRTRTRGAA